VGAVYGGRTRTNKGVRYVIMYLTTFVLDCSGKKPGSISIKGPIDEEKAGSLRDDRNSLSSKRLHVRETSIARRLESQRGTICGHADMSLESTVGPAQTRSKIARSCDHSNF
jgi:hypothetical protein